MFTPLCDSPLLWCLGSELSLKVASPGYQEVLCVLKNNSPETKHHCDGKARWTRNLKTWLFLVSQSKGTQQTIQSLPVAKETLQHILESIAL